MVEKRKRYVVVRESTQAKRRSISPTRATATPEVLVQSLTPDVPTSFARDGPLPVLPKRQADGLLLKDYRSVAESKVMAESLIRSQRKWADGDIFEKFWTKPLKSRKLDPAELENNPSKDSMTKLGNCTLSCKPHKFEIRLFGVLEPVKVSLAPPVQQLVQGPPPQSQPPTPATMASRQQYLSNPQRSSQPNPGVQTAPASISHAPPQQAITTSAQASVIPSSQGPAIFVSLAPPPNVPAPNFIAPAPPQNLHPQQSYHQQSGNQHMAQQGPPPRPDPVIQSLAVRAASDPELKALMRIVASGKATTEQLKTFQGHIDALTPTSNPPIAPTAGRSRSLVPAQGSVGALAQTHPQAAPQQIHPQNQQHPQQLQHPQHLHPQYIQHSQYPEQQPHLIHHPSGQYPQPQPTAQAPSKPRPFPQPLKQEITSVVFEFADSYSQGDRFLFPKYTILEYVKNGTMVKASFMVTRKPIDDLDEYYQPITVILESTSPRTLEILQKVVADQETTCKHMKHLMETRKRAEDSFLVFRLRRDPNEIMPNKPEARERIEPPQKAIRESRVRRDTSTPVQDSKSSTDHTPQPAPPSRPRVKTVKKSLPKEPPQSVTPSTKNELSASIPPTTPIPRTPRQPKPPRSRKGRIADPTKSCSLCNTSKTSLWRKADIHGENVTVCNACGIKWKTSTQRAAQVAAAQATGQPLPGMGSRENSGLEGVRPTGQQLVDGGPQMQFHSLPPGQTGFTPPQNDNGQSEYLPTAGAVQGGQSHQQPPPGHQGQHAPTVPPTQQQQIQTISLQQTKYIPQDVAAESMAQPSAVDKQNEIQLSAASSIVASHVAAHQPQHPVAPAPESEP